jgi:hypothetical protein
MWSRPSEQKPIEKPKKVKLPEHVRSGLHLHANRLRRVQNTLVTFGGLDSPIALDVGVVAAYMERIVELSKEEK